MRVCGIICEYDPFHNGHALHIRAARAATESDYVLCVMSGHFTQRGYPALVSKWARAEMALRSGADAVLELPALYAVRDADRFGLGGVSLLASTGVTTHLCFGSERGDLEALRSLARQPEAREDIREGLARGRSAARARGDALGLAAGAPNDTLALSYLRALDSLKSGMIPVAVRREGRAYHDRALDGLASATAVRAAVRRGEDVSAAMPASAYALLSRLLGDGAYQRPEGMDTALLCLLRSMEPGALAQIADVSEGMENRLLRAAQEAPTREALLALAKCKRFTRARLSRILTQALLGITKDLAAANPFPAYARLLGFRMEARPLVAAIARRGTVPLVTRAAKFRRNGGPAFALDLRAGDLWALGCAGEEWRGGGRDVTEPVVIV